MVRYTVAPGMRYQRGMWADKLRRSWTMMANQVMLSNVFAKSAA